MTLTEPVACTLLEEWRARRDVLTRGQGATSPFAKERARVLDFLIRRYADSPEAQRPAPVRSQADFEINQRAIIVLHHRWAGRVGGVKTRQEAQTRVATILKRISSPPSSEESDAPAVPDYSDSLKCRVEAKPCTSQARPQAWEVAELYQRLLMPDADDVEAAMLLTEGRTRVALRHVVYAWRELAAADRVNRSWTVLHRFLARPDPTELVIESVRESLAHDNGRARLAALDVLGCIGTLADISLLDDLLALPPAPEEHPEERRFLLQAMRNIANRRSSQ